MRQSLLLISLLIFACLPMNAAASGQLSGLWVGYYTYENGDRIEFSVVFDQHNELVIGTMIEPQTFGETYELGLPAGIIGNLKDGLLQFDKYYGKDIADPATMKLRPGARSIRYRLVLSAGGNVLSGSWNIGDVSGTATIRRVTPGNIDRIPKPD